MAGRHDRRRQKLIDPRLQYGLARRWLGLLALDLTFFLFLVTLLPAAAGYLSGNAQAGALDSLERARTVGSLLLLPLACTFLVLFAQTVREGLRIAGPVWRVRRSLQGLRSLRIPAAIGLRSKDEMHHLAEDFNAAMRSWAEHMSRAQDLTRRIDRQFRDTAPPEWAELRGMIEDVECPPKLRGPELPTPAPAPAESAAEEPLPPRQG